jgi:hypothetical protein
MTTYLDPVSPPSGKLNERNKIVDEQVLLHCLDIPGHYIIHINNTKCYIYG